MHQLNIYTESRVNYHMFIVRADEAALKYTLELVASQ